MICEKCGKETDGFRRRGPGHPTIPYCRVCFYPKRFAWCACGKVKSAGAFGCGTCNEKRVLAKRIPKLEAELQKAKDRLAFLENPKPAPEPEKAPSLELKS